MPATGIHHTPTVDTVWDGPAAVAAMPEEYAPLHYCHAWWTQAAADSSHVAGDDDVDDEKDSYKFPHHTTLNGPANVRGCRNVLARVVNSSIPDADKAGVRSHAQAHLDDANKKSGNYSRLVLPAGMQNVLRRIHSLAGDQPHKPWYRLVRADAGSPATLHIFGPIGGWFGANSEDFAADLAQVDGPLNVHINSGGGDAFEGIAIANLLRNHPSTVNGVVTGLAASAASIIAMGCDSLTMSPGTQLMIHRAMTSAYGNRGDFADVMDLLERMDTSLAGLYQARAGGDLADWESAMETETWYTPQEAVDAGLADHIAEPPAKAGAASTASNQATDRTADDTTDTDRTAGVAQPTAPQPVAPVAQATDTETDEDIAAAPEMDIETVRAALRDAFNPIPKEARS